MKKKLLPILALSLGTFALAQVGINTPTPRLTLDVNAIKTDGTTAEGIRAPRLTEAQVLAANNLYNLATIGAIVYVTSANAAPSTKTENITSQGYYYFDGVKWQKMQNLNIYDSDGTLAANRTVTMEDKTLDFTSTATTGTSHYRIDGSTFSVNSVDNRVGIGTIDPQAILNVTNPIQGGLVDAMAVGISNCGGLCGQGTARNMVLYNSNPTNTFFASIDFVPSGSSTALSGATIRGIDRDATNNFAGISFATRNATDYADRLTIRSSGLVGIANNLPATTLDVAGKIDATTPDGVLIPRFTVTQLAAKDAAYGSLQNGALVFVTSGVGSSGKTSDVLGAGIYYYDNFFSKWRRVGLAAEADGVIGNEVLNGTAGGALTRSGAGTAADPFTLGVPDQGITTVKIADENVTYAKIKTPVRTVTANYILTVEDEGGFIYVDSPTTAWIYINQTLPEGFHCVVIQKGVGQVRIAAVFPTGVNSARGLTTRTQYSAVGIIKRTPTEAYVTGDAIN
jgi:hypothetical protein